MYIWLSRTDTKVWLLICISILLQLKATFLQLKSNFSSACLSISGFIQYSETVTVLTLIKLLYMFTFI